MAFVRHFLISGLDSAGGLELEDDQQQGSRSGSSHARSGSPGSVASEFSPLERAYKAKVLRVYPDVESWSHFNSNAVCRLILPQGLRFCTDKEVANYSPKCHSFVLTKDDGERSYGVALIFYEQVSDSNICHAVHTLQKMYSTESEGGTLKRADRLRPKSSKMTSERSRSLPRHYQQSKLSTSTLDLSSASYDYRKDTLYVTKGISVICSQPLVHVASQILLAMNNYVGRSNFDIQVLENLIFSLLYELLLPQPGKTIKFFCIDGEPPVLLSNPKLPNELPAFDYNLLEFFDMLGVENALKLFTCALLEHQILVYSSDFEKLMLVCESVTSLMLPFAWQHVYVPILPPNLENFLDAPVPYIMGLLRRTHDIELSKKGSVCIVDIDNGELDVPEELPEFPYENELADEIRSNIVRFGGKVGAEILKEHAIESRDILELSSSQTRDKLDHETSETMRELNQMISRFETLSAEAHPVQNSNHDEQRLNNALREVFINRFVHMFLSFEHFIILPSEMDDQSLTPQQSETQQNFDKISFLSDQKRSHLPFLSSFLETQTFSTFIDDFIAQMNQSVPQETPFSLRLSGMKDRYGESLVRTPTYEPCDMIDTFDDVVLKRLSKVSATVSPNPRETVRWARSNTKTVTTRGVFPLIDPARLKSRAKSESKTTILKQGDRQSKSIDVNVIPASKISLLNSNSAAAIAETQFTFVQELLKECKTKTKRILLEKLGKEAVQWGHGSIGFSGSEENMLVASICDLIERIWSHGLQNRSGKSSLWHFLYKFGRANERTMKCKGTLGTQAFYTPFIRSRALVLPEKSRNIQVLITPRKKAVTFDPSVMGAVHNVASLKEIKTEIGYARAWIRVALERKTLATFLHSLVADPILLKNLYKRYAFLRSDEEREQAIHHLETLTTVDFSCFTNAYNNASVLYQVLIFPSPSKSGSTPCTANIWIQIVGSFGESSIMNLPKGIIHFCFWERNLGVITSLRIGHDNGGSNPNWLVEHILIRNEFTGHAYKFICGRWLGQSMEDGSTERYMVGYPLAHDCDMSRVIQTCANSPENPLPPILLKSVDPDSEVIEIQTMLGDAINRIVKFHHKSLNEKLSYAHLMCGKFGLVHALLNIFSFGYKSARLFGKNLFVWDFFLKVTSDFNQSISHLNLPASSQNSPIHMASARSTNTLDSPKRNYSLSNLLDSPRKVSSDRIPVLPAGTLSRSNQFRRMYTKLIMKIDTQCVTLGKDDKFQLFVCLSSHDRLLGKIVTDLTRSVAAGHLYEEFSFLRRPSLISFLSHILEAIQDISIPVDPAMTKHLEIKY